jgi:hypothetical protein
VREVEMRKSEEIWAQEKSEFAKRLERRTYDEQNKLLSKIMALEQMLADANSTIGVLETRLIRSEAKPTISTNARTFTGKATAIHEAHDMSSEVTEEKLIETIRQLSLIILSKVPSPTRCQMMFIGE